MDTVVKPSRKAKASAIAQQRKCQLTWHPRGKGGWYYPSCSGGCAKQDHTCGLETEAGAFGIVYYRCTCRKLGGGSSPPVIAFLKH